MSKENGILLSGLAVAAVLPLVLGWLLAWPAWVTAPVFVLVAAGIYRKLRHANPSAADHVGALLDKIGLYPGNNVRDLTARRIAQFLEAAGKPAIAHEVLRRFDA
ncbi:hypothetical protein FNH05_08265 [Amycolatopsis rhizosphaerae]|uniref:Uncharacterized protein n=1 Tax=Amycolatopsis rhizosphaerae TaxID=2053003 RepID=A0A558D6H9_9PSEU|nr:hypothetical protein [Amycolatopsis rhizosphaerae]TVT56619.1 hypothetical protein FNH05_08265 [Amycolatopsis rhizosphaerae]